VKIARLRAIFRYYNAAVGLWLPGLQVTYQGNLFDLSSCQVLNTTNLALGTYQVYFGVDLYPDGIVNEPLYYDRVTVSVVNHDSLTDLYVDIYDEQKAYNGLTYFADSHAPRAPRIVAVNMLGDITWQYAVPDYLRQFTNPGFDVEVLTNNHIVVCLQNNSPYQVVEIDKTSHELVWTYARNGLRTARDCDRLPNGNTLMVGVLEPAQDSVIFEVTAEGEIVWQLKIKDAPATRSPGFFSKAQRIRTQ